MVHYTCCVDGQVEATIDALASCREFGLSRCEAVDEARQHADVDGLSAALGQIASSTYTTQFLQLLELKKTFSDPAESALLNDRLVLSW